MSRESFASRDRELQVGVVDENDRKNVRDPPLAAMATFMSQTVVETIEECDSERKVLVRW
jgi:hypothetical protein